MLCTRAKLPLNESTELVCEICDTKGSSVQITVEGRDMVVNQGGAPALEKMQIDGLGYQRSSLGKRIAGMSFLVPTQNDHRVHHHDGCPLLNYHLLAGTFSWYKEVMNSPERPNVQRNGTEAFCKSPECPQLNNHSSQKTNGATNMNNM